MSSIESLKTPSKESTTNVPKIPVSDADQLASFYFRDRALKEEIPFPGKKKIDTLPSFLQESARREIQEAGNFYINYNSYNNVPEEYFTTTISNIDDLLDPKATNFDRVPLRTPGITRRQGMNNFLAANPIDFQKSISALELTVKKIAEQTKNNKKDKATARIHINEQVLNDKEVELNQYNNLGQAINTFIEQLDALQSSSSPEVLMLNANQIDVYKVDAMSVSVSQKAKSLIHLLQGFQPDSLTNGSKLQGMPGLSILLANYQLLYGADQDFLPVGVYGRNMINVLDAIANNGNTALFGPTGSGKTALAQKAAEYLGLPSLTVALSDQDHVSPDELIKEIRIIGGDTQVVPTAIAKLMLDGGILILDEFTKLRGGKQGVYNWLLGLTPTTKFTVGDTDQDDREIEHHPHPNFKVIITGNRALDGVGYTVHELNADIANRIGTTQEIQYAKVNMPGDNAEGFNGNTFPSVEVENGVVTKLSERENDQTISGFWRHEFALVSLLRLVGPDGRITISPDKFKELVSFVMKLNAIHSLEPISIRKIDSMIKNWKNQPSQNLVQLLRQEVIANTKNEGLKTQKLALINDLETDFKDIIGIPSPDSINPNTDLTHNLTINFSTIAELLGINGLKKPKVDNEKKTEIDRLVEHRNQLLIEVQTAFSSGYCGLPQ